MKEDSCGSMYSLVLSSSSAFEKLIRKRTKARLKAGFKVLIPGISKPFTPYLYCIYKKPILAARSMTSTIVIQIHKSRLLNCD